MELDIPLHFLDQFWNKLSSNKNSCNYSFFDIPFEKKILSKLQEWAILLIFLVFLFFFLKKIAFLKVDFFLLYFFVFIPLGGP